MTQILGTTHIPKDFARLVSGITAIDVLHYAATAGACWLFFYVFRRRDWLHRKIIAEFPSRRDTWREAGLSLLTCLIYGVVAAVCLWAAHRGWTRLYFDIGAYGWGWFFASIVLTLVVHDAYAYWTHRLMHHRRLFSLVHRAHHRSTNPTPIAAYAFHPLEALIQAGFLPLVIFLYPMHPIAFALYTGWELTWNVVAHGGFEIFPRWLLRSRLGKYVNTPTFHTMHHEYTAGNYGFYSNIWDRLMRTAHKKYEARFAEVTSRGDDLIKVDDKAVG